MEDTSTMSVLLPWLASQVGKALFLPEPDWAPDDEQRATFDQVSQSMLEAPAGSEVKYVCLSPKWEFLRYLVHDKDMVLHGSNRPDIEVLEPKEQTDYSGKRVRAVFASRDAIWPLFFAVLNTEGYRGSLRNGCWVVSRQGQEQRFYFFSVNRERLGAGLWTEGTIYILPGQTFEMTDRGVVRFDEWASKEPVRPVARLGVEPADFLFLDQVAGHREGESMFRSWLMYKRRRGIRPG